MRDQMKAVFSRLFDTTEDVVYIIPFYDQTVQAYRTDRFTGWPVAEGGKLALEDITSLILIEPVR